MLHQGCKWLSCQIQTNISWERCPDSRGGRSLVLYLPDLSRHQYVHVKNFPISTWHALHYSIYTSKLCSFIMTNFKTQTNCHSLQQVMINGMWQTSTCVWDHVCNFHCSMLTSRENIPVQMQIMSEYMLLYETLLNCLCQPPSGMWFDRLMDQQHWKRLVIICKLLPIIRSCLRLTVFGWNT